MAFRRGAKYPALALALASSTPVLAGQAEVRDAIVAVVVQGVNTQQGSAPIGVQGTGFFITQDGFLVTANHLVRDLVERGVDPGTLTIKVRTSTGLILDVGPKAYYADEPTDVMVLKAAVPAAGVKALQRSKLNPELGKTDIYSAGYPDGIGYSYSHGFLRSGPAGVTPFWTTTLTFKNGESGSPILFSDDTVFAVVKGDDADATQIGFVSPVKYVPPQYWDSTQPQNQDVAHSGHINVEQLTTPQPAYREVYVLLQNSHCDAPQRKTQIISPRQGWKIDPASAAVTAISSRGLNGPPLVDVATSDQIVVGAQLTNLGKCLLNNEIAADITAEVQARVRFKEVPSSPQWVTVTSISLAKDVKAAVPDQKAGALRFSFITAAGDSMPLNPIGRELAKVHGASVLDTSLIRSRMATGG